MKKGDYDVNQIKPLWVGFYFVKLNLNHCFEVFPQHKSEQLQSEQHNKILFWFLAGECM